MAVSLPYVCFLINEDDRSFSGIHSKVKGHTSNICMRRLYHHFMSKWIQQEENTLCENLTQTLNDTHDDTWFNKDIKSWLYILKNEHGKWF